jgi:hypothetical protein
MSPGTSMHSIGDIVPLLSSSERTSMQAMILGLQKLPPISLEVEPVGDRFGNVPFAPVFHVHPSSGVILETRFTLFANGPQPGETAKVGDSGDFSPFTLHFVGIFGLQVSRTGIQNTGITTLIKLFHVEGVQPPPPPPPPQTAKLHLALINQSGKFFKIAGVTWTVWHQTIAGFTQLATVNGESVTVQPIETGQQYHIHGDVVATRISTGDNELAEFRGTATGPGGAVTLVIVGTNSDQSRTFRLVAESPQIGLVNPVVEL